MTALEAGGSAVVRGNWRDHISVPLQTGRGWTWVGPGAAGTRGDICCSARPAYRSEAVSVL